MNAKKREILDLIIGDLTPFDLICYFKNKHNLSLKDAKNSLRFLNEDGVIIFHDCNPQSPEAATAHLPSKKINWNGDVWKTIYHFRHFANDFDCFTYDDDEGLGVLKMKKGTSPLTVSKLDPLSHINNLNYYDLQKNRDQYLGLKKLKS